MADEDKQAAIEALEAELAEVTAAIAKLEALQAYDVIRDVDAFFEGYSDPDDAMMAATGDPLFYNTDAIERQQRHIELMRREEVATAPLGPGFSLGAILLAGIGLFMMGFGGWFLLRVVL